MCFFFSFHRRPWQQTSTVPDGSRKQRGVQVANVIQDNSTLTSLDVSGNDIPAEGIRGMAQVLTGNSSLKVLKLRFNKVDLDLQKLVRDSASYSLQKILF